jgi:transposase
VVEMLHAWMIA